MIPATALANLTRTPTPPGRGRAHAPLHGDFGDAWRDKARCLGEPVEIFFPPDQQQYAWHPDEAKVLCAQYPVRAQCRDFALRNNIAHGVWGGMTARELIRSRRTRRPERGTRFSADGECPECGHHRTLHDADGCSISTCHCRRPYVQDNS